MEIINLKCGNKGTLDIFHISVFIADFEQVNAGSNGQVKWKIHVIFILILFVPLFRPSVFRVVYFSIFIPIYRDTTIFRDTILKQTNEKKI